MNSFTTRLKQDKTNMLNYLAAYGAAALAFLALDVVWLGFIAKSFYRDGIGHLMADTPNLVAGGVFYLLYPAGVLLFALAPAAWSGGLVRRPYRSGTRSLAARNLGWGTVWLLCLWHLRPQQPGHFEGLAVAPDLSRYRLGHGTHCYRSFGGTLGPGEHDLSRANARS